ncbi:MAG: hypothetical protein COA72_05650, partial [Candidatus Neomarinimicrobiota bacterium]
MIRRYFFQILFFTYPILLGNESAIDLKTFPRPTMNAVESPGGILIDSHVNESAWLAADSITEFYQS